MIRPALIAILLSAPALAQTSVATGDCSPVIAGDNNQQTVICGYTIDQHEVALARREGQIRADMERLLSLTQRASDAELNLLKSELAEIKRKRDDLETSFEKTLIELTELRDKLADIGEGFSQARIDEARQALEQGDTSKADALFAEVEAMEQQAIERAADAAFQRGRIAEDDVRWLDAADHYARAARLLPNGENLNKAQGFALRAGRYKKAVLFGTDNLDFVIEEHGERSQKHASALNNLGMMVRAIGDFGEAEPLFLQSLDIMKDTTGPQHPAYAIALNNLAELYRDMGRYPKAVPLLRQAIEVQKATIGEAHHDYGTSLNNLANTLRAMNQLTEAETLYRQSLDITKASLGDRHPSYATSLNNLANVLQDREVFDEAERLFRQAIEIDKATIGDEHPNYAMRISNLATVLMQMDRMEEAEQLYRQAAKIGKATLGKRHPSYAIDLHNLAALLQSTDRIDQAAPLYAEALAILKASLGEEHPNTFVVAGNYAHFLREKLPDDPALAKLEATFGPDIGK